MEKMLWGIERVVITPNLGNEGLTSQTSDEGIRDLEAKYLAGLRELAAKLRERMRSGARLVFGGPYPNNDNSIKCLMFHNYLHQQTSLYAHA